MSFMTPIFILFLMACAWNVEGKALLKQRLNILDIRMNSIEQDIETLNASFINREDQICECSNANADIEGPIKQNFGQSVVASKQSETRIKKGLMDEKKWMRQKVNHVENEVHKVINQVVEDNKNANAETVRKMMIKENDLDRKLNEMNVVIAEVAKHCRNKIANQEENNKDTTAKIISKIQTVETEQDRKLNEIIVANAEVTKNFSDKIANQEESNKDTTAEIMTKILTIETKQDRKLNVAIAEAMANYSDEIRKRDMKIDEQQIEIDKLKQIVNKMKEVILCPDGWTEFQSFCYLYVKEQKNYDSARKTCLQLEASVADIQSSSENDFVFNLCEDNGHTWGSNHLWVGFSDEETEGVWISDRTRETSTYMNWRPGQPDLSFQDCILMGDIAPYDQWNDIDCQYTYKFVCKKKLPYF